MNVLSRANIEFVVQLTLSTLSRCNLRACAIGSVAALVHGIDYRDPKDVDLLILDPCEGQDAEKIKQTVVETDSLHFSLTPSRVAGATHRILWCTLSSDDYPMRGTSGRTGNSKVPVRMCKVDILTPEQLYLRHIPESELYRDEESTFMGHFEQPPSRIPISYMPLSALLMLKLRAWADHSLPSANQIKHGKIPQDEDDIQEILQVGIHERKLGVVNYRGIGEDEMWMLGGFGSWKEAEGSVGRFVKKWPRSVKGWRAACRI